MSPTPAIVSTSEPPRAPVRALEAGHGEMFRLMIQGVRDYAIFMLDPNGVVISWNEGAQRIKGYAAHEIIGQHFSRFYPQEALDRGWPEEELRIARREGRLEDEGWRLRKDGSRFWANVIITALRDAQGEVIGFTKVTRDLTERREHEERLRQSEENIRRLVEGVHGHAIFTVDADGRVMDWNAGAERVLGFRAVDIVGHPLAQLYPDEERQAARAEELLRAARTQGHAQDTGWRLRADGSRVWAETSLSALRGSDGTLRGYAAILRDLSERRRVQELETEGRRINEFIAMLAHELRNPIAPIANAAGVLERIARGSSDVSWCADIIRRQVTHLSRLVEDLLDVSRITSGKIQLRRERLDLREVVRKAVDASRALVEAYQHRLEVDLPPEPLPVEGDETRLTQVVVNLLNNATKYTPRGGHVRIVLQREEPGQEQGREPWAVLRVIDNGIGMSPTLLATAFDLFVQGERTIDRAEGGLGIGLTLVRRIVKLHGGQTKASSPGPGLGSELTVRLPLAAVAPGEAAEPLPAEPEGGRRVLVVDDNRDAADSLAQLLGMCGHSVWVAYDGAHAIELAARHVPDVILLDLGLPGMDGFEVARRLRGIPQLRAALLVAVTGYGQEGDRRAVADAGFGVHLVKPVGPEELLQVVEGRAA
ncbi:hybrid sensor histidine kinase/response regulator [Caldimonas aquatica]|uniref:histidine kinase n=1 Tax=Caldimonas aquatica TaxID=376175 RepID=A0ABY6MS50_9BURK|nr:PAS domain S-box protein [Schlegelella aquatica]UZD54841.1 PAS domain S-box protein [Schlegelella aquatica]